MDEIYIQQVYQLAEESTAKGFDPFGAILVYDGKAVASTADRCIQYSDPTAHAELILISEYCRENKLISLENHTLYCNVEPCIMCSGAIHWARISRVVFGIRQASLQKVSKGKNKLSCEELINSGNKQVEIVGPILEEEGIAAIKKYAFLSKKERHKKYWFHS